MTLTKAEAKVTFMAAGRRIAAAQCRAHGTSHSRLVYAEMVKQGYPVQDFDGRWLGWVFRSPEFQETGLTYHPTDEDYRNTHGDTHSRNQQGGCKIWRLR